MPCHDLKLHENNILSGIWLSNPKSAALSQEECPALPPVIPMCNHCDDLGGPASIQSKDHLADLDFLALFRGSRSEMQGLRFWNGKIAGPGNALLTAHVAPVVFMGMVQKYQIAHFATKILRYDGNNRLQQRTSRQKPNDLQDGKESQISDNIASTYLNSRRGGVQKVTTCPIGHSTHGHNSRLGTLRGSPKCSLRALDGDAQQRRETWQVQKSALFKKFGAAGWSPRKRLSPDSLEGIRALHAQYPEKFKTSVLADHFKVSPEAIRRILKSKWRPSDEEDERRRERWNKRGVNIWDRMNELGIKAPRKWRNQGVGKSQNPGVMKIEQSELPRGIQRLNIRSYTAHHRGDPSNLTAVKHETVRPVSISDKIF